ncbi:MAG: hypothetical protein M3Q08_02420 [Pseudomonadota bacterium]|nr:hypothetical protein [Pseudomonadota bacterium]
MSLPRVSWGMMRTPLAWTLRVTMSPVYSLPDFLKVFVATHHVHAREVARQLRTGQVNINGPGIDFLAPSVATSNPATAVSG